MPDTPEHQRQQADEQVERRVSGEDQRENLLRGLDEDSPDNAEATRQVQASTDADADVEQMSDG